MIKLLALDLDGTLLDSHGMVTDANREAILAAEAQGVLVTIATGRRFRDARPVGIELGLKAPIITHNGALLKYADSLETVNFSLLSTEESLEILRVGRNFGGDALLSTDPHGKGRLFYDRVSDYNIPLQKYVEWSKKLHGNEAEEAVHQVPSLDDILPDHHVIHISFSGGCREMAALQQVIESEIESPVTLLATIYSRLDFTLLDILPANASKGAGVGVLSELIEITPEEVMAIGDNFNDLAMLEFAGTAVVMENSTPALLENDDFHKTASNDENGVARAIERFILSPDNHD